MLEEAEVPLYPAMATAAFTEAVPPAVPRTNTSSYLHDITRLPAAFDQRLMPPMATLSEVEMRLVETFRSRLAQHAQHEPPKTQMILDQIRVLDSQILEAVLLYLKPYQSSVLKCTSLVETTDAAILSRAVFGHTPRAQEDDIVASALDMQEIKRWPTSVILRAYIAAALYEWVFSPSLRIGWNSTTYRTKKMEGYIRRGQFNLCEWTYRIANVPTQIPRIFTTPWKQKLILIS